MKKTALPQKPGWTAITSVSTNCDKCGKYLGLGQTAYWRERPKSEQDGADSTIVKTEISCGECVEKK